MEYFRRDSYSAIFYTFLRCHFSTSNQDSTNIIFVKNNGIGIDIIGSGTLQVRHCIIIIKDVSKDQKQYANTYFDIFRMAM
jgi:hypothetical protein